MPAGRSLNRIATVEADADGDDAEPPHPPSATTTASADAIAACDAGELVRDMYDQADESACVLMVHMPCWRSRRSNSLTRTHGAWSGMLAIKRMQTRAHFNLRCSRTSP